MRRKKIGIVIPPASAGGVHQYALSIAQSLITHGRELDYAIIHDTGERPELFRLPEGTSVEFIARDNPYLGRIHRVRKALHFLGAATGCAPLLIRRLPDVAARTGIDLLIFPTPLTYDLPIGLPFVTTIPDMQHHHTPDDPDYGRAVVMKRDIIYGYFARHSLLTTTDSDQTRSDIERWLKVGPGKVRVLPYIAPNYVYEYRGMPRERARALLAHYDLPERFVFYPAQFWHLKNHDRLIRALHAIRDKHGVDVPLVTCGNAGGRYAAVFDAVAATVRSLGMEDLFRHLGYVGNRQMVALYRTAAALVAPAIEGPTNLPPIEALVLGAPIVTVRLFDIPKQVGKAALLFDPYDVNEMADCIYRVWTDADLRSALLAHGTERARAYLPERFAALWKAVIADAFDILAHSSSPGAAGVRYLKIPERF